MVRRVPAFLLLTLAALPAAAADAWIRLTPPDASPGAAPGIEFFTTAPAPQAAESLRRLSQTRDFLQTLPAAKKLSEISLRIVEFRDPAEYLSFNPTRIARAYYAATPLRNYLVLGPVPDGATSLDVHEYLHLVARQGDLKLPVWLIEGWVDVFSTLQLRDGAIVSGAPLPARVKSLGNDEWLDYQTFTRVNTASAFYNELSRPGIFYAQSWALAHMVLLAPEYRANFGKFFAALSAGRNMNEASTAAWGRTGEQVLADLKNYVRAGGLQERALYTAVNTVQAAEPAPSPVSAFDIAVLNAELMFAIGRLPEATAEFERLDKEQPGRAEIARAFGELAIGRNDLEGARLYLEKAFQAGDQDPGHCLSLAALEQKHNDAPKMVAALERALKSRPASPEMQILLGLGQADMRRFDNAIATLMAIQEIRPEAAPAVFCGLAVAYIETGDLDGARGHLATCRTWAKTEDASKRVTQLTAFLDARAQPDAAVRKGEKRGILGGTAIQLDCESTGRRLQILAGEKVAIFDVPNFTAVEMASLHGQKLSLQCGQLPPARVSVEFAPPLTAIGNSSGIVRRIEF